MMIGPSFMRALRTTTCRPSVTAEPHRKPCFAIHIPAIFVLLAGLSLAAEPLESTVRLELVVAGSVGWTDKARLRVASKTSGAALVVEFRRKQTRLYQSTPGKAEKLLWKGKTPFQKGTHTVILRLDGEAARLSLDQRQLSAPRMGIAGRLNASFQAGKAFTAAKKPRVQRLGKIVFADDFSRTEEDAGIWQKLMGEFAINASRAPGTSQDAFQYWGRAPQGRGIALATMSRWFWADYRVGVSARLSDLPGTWGIVFHYVNPDTYHALRWQQPDSGPGELQLLRRSQGRDEVLAAKKLSMCVEQWNRVDLLVCGTTAVAYVNGVRTLSTTDPSLSGGRIGLLVEGRSSVFFDDVMARSIRNPPSTSEALSHPFGPHEQPWCDFSKKSFFKDQFMVQWAHPRALWQAGNSASRSARLFRTWCFNDAQFSWRNTSASSSHWPAKPIHIGLFTEKTATQSGYHFLLSADQLELQRNGKLITTSPIQIKSLTSLLCEAHSGRIRCLVNDQEVLLWQDAEPITRGYVLADLGPAHDISSRSGATVYALRRPDWRDTSTVTSTHRLDYNFDFAPAAWKLHSGRWRSTNRWACVPLWSFFAGRGTEGVPGVNYENCLLWSRRRFPGDFDLELFVSPLEGTPQRVHFSYPVTLNVAFAADGEQLDSGYMLLFGTYDLPTRLYSRGRLLAEDSERIIPLLRRDPRTCYARLTRPWQHLRIQRQGAHITVHIARHDDGGSYLGLQQVFDVEDPEPPQGDHLGLWTWGANGLAIARVSVSYASSSIAGAEDAAGASLRKTSVQSRKMSTRRGAIRSFQRITNSQPGGAFSYDLLDQAKQLARNATLDFDFRPGSGELAISLQATIRGQVAEAPLSGEAVLRDRTIPLTDCFADQPPAPGEWAHVTLPLGRLLGDVFPAGPLVLDRLTIASLYQTIEQIAGLRVNRKGASYDLANLRWTTPDEAPPAPPTSFSFRIRGIDPLDDFEHDLGEWRTLGGWDGAALHRYRHASPQEGTSLRLLNRRIAGPAGAWAVETPYNASAFPLLTFRYRLPASMEVNLLVKANGRWYEITATGIDNLWPLLGRIHKFQADNQWHDAQVDLYRLLGSRLRSKLITVEALAWGDTFRMSSPQATAWWVDDFCRVPAVPAGGELTIDLEGPQAQPITAYSHLLDDKPTTTPPEQETGRGASLKIKPSATVRFLHVRVQLADGRWSSPRHLPLTTGTIIEIPDQPTPIVVTKPPPAPYISYIPSDSLCRNEFEWDKTPEFPEQHQGEFAIRRSTWILFAKQDGATGKGSIDIMSVNGQEVFSGYLRKSEWKPSRWPKVAFDYKFPQKGTALTLTLLTSGALAVIEWTGAIGNNAYYQHERVRAVVVGNIGPAVQDGAWHHVEFDLREMIKQEFHAAGELPEALKVREFGTWACSPNPRTRATFSNPAGARVRIDNFTIFSQAGQNPAFEWALHKYAGQIEGYAYSWDQAADTVPPSKISTAIPRTEFANVAAGTWYFHVRACGADGAWGETAHRRVVVTP